MPCEQQQKQNVMCATCYVSESSGAQQGPSRRSILLGTVAANSLLGRDPALGITLNFKLLQLQADVEDIVYGKVAPLPGRPNGILGISVADILRLVFHDAASYNPETGEGGFNGSVRFPEELSRPENAGLAPVVDKLLGLQKRIQRDTGANVSFADVEAITAQAILQQASKALLCSKSVEGSCDVVYKAYGNKPKPLDIGRADAPGPDPAGQIPWAGNSVGYFTAAGRKLGLKPRELVSLAPALLLDEEEALAVLSRDGQYTDIITDLEKSKRTRTRATYEVEQFAALQKLVNFARFDPKAYA